MKIQRIYQIGVFILLTSLLISVQVQAQKRKNKKSKAPVNTVNYEAKLYEGLTWRSIGPYRGGRSAAVTGVPGKPTLFYMGTAGGGVWRTTDGGSTWENISDGFFGGSIGAVAVSEYDNNVIYVGGGEVTVRGNVSSGYGMWKSQDAGQTWTAIGLENSRHIPRIRIHPKNPDLVYAAVMGDLFKSSEERGVYRSKDGGQTWEKILYANADAGAVDLTFDPNNPRILYASTWRIRRTPYSLESGGEGSALWKSTDGGDTWTEITGNKGLPKGTIGIIGVTVSPVNSQRVWAIIENKDGGVFRSDDGGKTWKKTNSERKLRQRAWYYSRIYADTQDEDRVYVMNVRYHRSKDGGKTFETFNAPHGDHHDLWIAPEDNQRMVIADDGGAQVSYDAGENWSTYYNQPTAQFYRVTTDNHFPYRIYGAQQDNSTVRILHRTSGGSIGERDWEPTAGGESAHIAPNPVNPDIVYGGSYDGYLSRIDHKNDQRRLVDVWPDNPMGHGAEDMKYRFQWNFPIFFSPHDPNKLYTTSNQVHVSTNEGQSWEIISPDLTRNDPSTLGPSGGPITKDNTAVEYYGTIFAAVESPQEEGVIWVGSDDGLVHITQDGGKNWQNITPAGMPEWMMINCIEVDPFTKGGAYMAGTKYKSGDNAPYLYKTKDYGKTWTKITSGIPADEFTRVIRADPKRKGLLYAGTEKGMHISFDDGASWHPFQLNLPIVPITDLAIKDDNLIAATQGRSFWMIDDLTPLHQINDQVANSQFYLFNPMASYKIAGRGRRSPSKTSGQNHPGGVMVHYYVKSLTDSTRISLEFMEQDGSTIKTYSSSAKKKNEKIETKEGLNRFVWDMRYADAESFDGLIMWWASVGGPTAKPGAYKVKLTVDGQSMEVPFEILPDPRATATPADYEAQFDFLIAVRDKLSETHQAIKQIREVRGQINKVTESMKDKEEYKPIIEESKRILEEMKEVEEALYQTKNRSGQDPLNFPIRLNNKLAHLSSQVGMGNNPPTAQAEAVRKEITKAIDKELTSLNKIMEQDIPALNQQIKDTGIDFISAKKAETIN
jgi:photosystem II stability/assembly factor-like uncharacterized protein